MRSSIIGLALLALAFTASAYVARFFVDDTRDDGCDALDHSLQMTFPASDPPAHSHFDWGAGIGK